MIESAITGTGNNHLTDGETRQLGDALNILARIITRSVLREKLCFRGSQDEEYDDSVVRGDRVTTAIKPDEPLTLSVQATAKMLGLGRASAYEAIRTGQIPSIRFGKRIVVPRAALNSMLSQADSCKFDGVQ